MTVLNQPPGSKCGNVDLQRLLLDARRAAGHLRHEPLAPDSAPHRRSTALTGPYDIDLNFLPDTGPMMFNGQAINADAPSLQTAVREQLGLKLDSTARTARRRRDRSRERAHRELGES
jgi:uncharacterized protein (TIGR03435 family)